jgi:hypothetical protein
VFPASQALAESPHQAADTVSLVVSECEKARGFKGGRPRPDVAVM